MTDQLDRIIKRVEVQLEAAGYRGAIKLVRLALEEELGPQVAAAATQAALPPAAGVAPVQAPRPVPAPTLQAPVAPPAPAAMPVPAPPAPKTPVEIDQKAFRAADGEWWAPSERVREHLPLWTVTRVALNDGRQVYWTFALENKKRGRLTMRFLRNATTAARQWNEVLAVFVLRLGVPVVRNSDELIGTSIALNPDKALLQSADAIAKAMGYCLDCGEWDGERPRGCSSSVRFQGGNRTRRRPAE